MIDIIKHLIEKAKNDGQPAFSKFVKTLDNTKMILESNYDSDDFDEQKAYDTKEEKIVVNRDNNRNKRQNWKNKPQKKEEKKQSTYGNSYDRKG